MYLNVFNKIQKTVFSRCFKLFLLIVLVNSPSKFYPDGTVQVAQVVTSKSKDHVLLRRLAHQSKDRRHDRRLALVAL